jgi:peptidyl-prolyl cis-trans isomerase C
MTVNAGTTPAPIKDTQMFHISRILAASLIALTPLAVTAQEADPSKVLATVNGTEITLGHVIDLYSVLPEEYRKLPASQLFDGLLDQLVQQTLLEATVTEKPLNLQLRIENDARQLTAASVISKIADEAVNDEMLKTAYGERYANAAPGKEFNAAHILVDTKEKADALEVRIKAGEDFAKLAQENSSDTSAQNGGDLGWFGLGMMVKPFEDAVVALKKGEVSQPVESQFGWHIIKLLDERLLETPSFDQVKDQLTNDLRREAVEAEMKRLETEGKVDRADLTGFDPEIIRKTEILQ